MGMRRPAGWLIDRLRFSDLPGCCLLKSIQNFTADSRQQIRKSASQPAAHRYQYLNTLRNSRIYMYEAAD
jgi:hypothetical protein